MTHHGKRTDSFSFCFYLSNHLHGLQVRTSISKTVVARRRSSSRYLGKSPGRVTSFVSHRFRDEWCSSRLRWVRLSIKVRPTSKRSYVSSTIQKGSQDKSTYVKYDSSGPEVTVSRNLCCKDHMSEYVGNWLYTNIRSLVLITPKVGKDLR